MSMLWSPLKNVSPPPPPQTNIFLQLSILVTQFLNPGQDVPCKDAKIFENHLNPVMSIHVPVICKLERFVTKKWKK